MLDHIPVSESCMNVTSMQNDPQMSHLEILHLETHYLAIHQSTARTQGCASYGDSLFGHTSKYRKDTRMCFVWRLIIRPYIKVLQGHRDLLHNITLDA